MLSQHMLSQQYPREGGAHRPKGDGRREGSRGAAKELPHLPDPAAREGLRRIHTISFFIDLNFPIRKYFLRSTRDHQNLLTLDQV